MMRKLHPDDENCPEMCIKPKKSRLMSSENEHHCNVIIPSCSNVEEVQAEPEQIITAEVDSEEKDDILIPKVKGDLTSFGKKTSRAMIKYEIKGEVMSISLNLKLSEMTNKIQYFDKCMTDMKMRRESLRRELSVQGFDHEELQQENNKIVAITKMLQEKAKGICTSFQPLKVKKSIYEQKIDKLEKKIKAFSSQRQQDFEMSTRTAADNRKKLENSMAMCEKKISDLEKIHNEKSKILDKQAEEKNILIEGSERLKAESKVAALRQKLQKMLEANKQLMNKKMDAVETVTKNEDRLKLLTENVEEVIAAVKEKIFEIDQTTRVLENMQQTFNEKKIINLNLSQKLEDSIKQFEETKQQRSQILLDKENEISAREKQLLVIKNELNAVFQEGETLLRKLENAKALYQNLDKENESKRQTVNQQSLEVGKNQLLYSISKNQLETWKSELENLHRQQEDLVKTGNHLRELENAKKNLAANTEKINSELLEMEIDLQQFKKTQEEKSIVISDNSQTLAAWRKKTQLKIDEIENMKTRIRGIKEKYDVEKSKGDAVYLSYKAVQNEVDGLQNTLKEILENAYKKPSIPPPRIFQASNQKGILKASNQRSVPKKVTFNQDFDDDVSEGSLDALFDAYMNRGPRQTEKSAEKLFDELINTPPEKEDGV